MSSKPWEQFILYGKIDPQIRKVILDSWKHCKNLGISPSLDEVFSHTTEAEFKRRKRENHLLIQAATPIMVDLFEQLKGGGYMFLLTDAEGYIIEMIADAKARSIADHKGISPGARWKEENVGSTGLSIALRTRMPMATSGFEHFCSAFRVWDCSACPIFVEREFVGVFDICRSGPGTDVKELFAIAVSSAKTIGERFLADKLKKKELFLLRTIEEYTRLKSSIGMISFDSLGRIVYKDQIAKEFIQILEEENNKLYQLNGEKNLPVLELLGERETIELLNRKYFVKSKKIFNDENKLGTIVFIEKQEKVSSFYPQVFNSKVNSRIFQTFPTQNSKLLHSLKVATKIADSDSAILIQGESGCGKDFLARSIHEQSNRSKKPFISVNCASLPRELIVSELFGYMAGAFTGANKLGKEGRFEAANGGTLFLDEIGDMPLDLQAVLLRTLEEKQVVRIGSNNPIPIDVRIISATHKDLRSLIRKDLFREDLFYRLNVFQISLPSLRERKEDLESLINNMMEISAKKANRVPIKFTSDAINVLQQYPWPGNLRELRNIIERITYLHDGEIFDQKDIIPNYESKFAEK